MSQPIERITVSNPVVSPGGVPMHNPQPSLGRIVHVIVDPARNNGTDVCAAVVTRVLSPVEANADASGAGAWAVNLRVLYEGPDIPWIQAAYLFADEASARASGASRDRAFWPPRVDR